jgi:hypothetical protein
VLVSPRVDAGRLDGTGDARMVKKSSKKTPRKKASRKTKAQEKREFWDSMKQMGVFAEEQAIWVERILRAVERAGIDRDIIPGEIGAMAALFGIPYEHAATRDFTWRELDVMASAWIAKQQLVRTQRAMTTVGNQSTADGEGLSVSIEKLTAILDGKEYDLDEQPARWLKVLLDNGGQWISAPQLKHYDDELDGARTVRLRKSLPRQLSRLIITDRRKGARLKLA